MINNDFTCDCNLDFDFLTYCRPVYSFSRLDSAQAKISPGSNFRHADYFNQNRRTLIKAYGLTFIVNVHGSAGKFSVVPTLLNLGAGLALLSVATIICDIVVLYCHSKRVFYKSAKFQLVGKLGSVMQKNSWNIRSIFVQVRGEDAYTGGSNNAGYEEEEEGEGRVN